MVLFEISHFANSNFIAMGHFPQWQSLTVSRNARIKFDTSTKCQIIWISLLDKFNFNYNPKAFLFVTLFFHIW